VYQKIISQQPPHDVYVEPFLGGGAIMRRKLPARINIGVDLDPGPIAAAEAMVDVGVNERYFYCGDGIEMLGDWARYRGLLWTRFGHLTSAVLVYCDPPYLMSVRRRHRPVYRCELEDSDHVRLLDVVLKLPCMVQISGYWSELYASRLSAWRTISFQAQTRGGKSATEWLWMNYPEPVELHDYRYLGRNFRERERLKRLRERWLARLARMGELERGALLSAMRSTWSPGRG